MELERYIILYYVQLCPMSMPSYEGAREEYIQYLFMNIIFVVSLQYKVFYYVT